MTEDLRYYVRLDWKAYFQALKVGGYPDPVIENMAKIMVQVVLRDLLGEVKGPCETKGER